MLKRCSFCRKGGSAGCATSYWRWFVTGTTAVGYRLYSCIECTLMLIERMGAAATPLFVDTENLTCTKCGGEWNDGDPEVWAYIYPPKMERTDYDIPLCHECLDPWVETIRHSGIVLTDRDQSARAGRNDPWVTILPTR